MQTHSLTRRLASEFLAAAFVMTVLVGSSLQAQQVSKDTGVVMLFVWFSLICALALTIFMLSPISGAHFNPIVSWVMVTKGQLKTSDAFAYTVAQILGASVGTMVANLMFNTPLIQFATRARNTPGELIGEFISTAGLIALILTLNERGLANWSWAAVTGWIGSCFLFTASTCFANPAVTIARVLNASPVGIEAGSVPGFILVQIIAGASGTWLAKFLAPKVVTP